MEKINFNRELQYEPDWEEVQPKVKVRRCIDDATQPTKTTVVPFKSDDDGEYIGTHKGFFYQLFGSGKVNRSKRKEE